MIFFGLRQAVEDPSPILRVLDVNKQVVVTHRSRKHNLQHPYAPKRAFFMKKRPTMAILWSKVGIFRVSPISRALDAKKQIPGTHRSRKHNLPHPYAPKYAIFHEKRPKMAVFCQILIFWLCTSS